MRPRARLASAWRNVVRRRKGSGLHRLLYCAAKQKSRPALLLLVHSGRPTVDLRGARNQARAVASCDDHLVADLARTATELVAKHLAVRHVELAGSRSRGTHAELSDWDFAVTTSDFAAVARDLPALIAPLHPLGQQWEPLGHFPVYQVLLPGPTKVEYLFLDQSQQPLPASKPGPATLDAINTHFWDWIWWIATKAAIGRNDLVAEHLPQLFGRLLRPIGVTEPPADIGAAIDAFISRRDELERDYGITVSRALEEEVRAGIRRLGLTS